MPLTSFLKKPSPPQKKVQQLESPCESAHEKRNSPATKHCQTGVGQEWDQVRGDSIGEVEEEGGGAGEEESGSTRGPPGGWPPATLLTGIRLGMGPYRGVGAVSVGFLSRSKLEDDAAAAAAATAAAW